MKYKTRKIEAIIKVNNNSLLEFNGTLRYSDENEESRKGHVCWDPRNVSGFLAREINKCADTNMKAASITFDNFLRTYDHYARNTFERLEMEEVYETKLEIKGEI